MPLPWRAVDARRGICGSNNVPARTHISGAVVLGLLRAPVTKMALLPMATSTRPDGMQTALGNCPRIFATSRVSEDWCAKRDRVTPSNKFNIQSTFNQHSINIRVQHGLKSQYPGQNCRVALCAKCAEPSLPDCRAHFDTLTGLSERAE